MVRASRGRARRGGGWIAVAIALAPLTACTKEHVRISEGPADRALVDEFLARAEADEPLGIPAHVEWKGHWRDEQYVSPPKVGITSDFDIAWGDDETYVPVRAPIQEVLDGAVYAWFDRPDDRDSAIASDSVHVEFLPDRLIMVRQAGSERLACDFELTCRMTFPDGSELTSFDLESAKTGILQVPAATGDPNPPWQGAVELGEEFTERMREPSIRETLERARHVEWVCEYGHAKPASLGPDEHFCEQHGTSFEERVVLRP